MKKNYSVVVLMLLGLGIVVLMGCQSKELTSAKVYIQQDNWDKAIEQLEIGVQLYPNDAEAYELLGEGYARRGQYQKMNNAFNSSLAITDKFKQRILQVRDRYWVQHYNSGVKKLNAGRVQAAIEEFSTCIVIDDKRVDAYKTLGASYTQLDSIQLAIDYYTKALELDPNDVKLINILGNIYLLTKNYEKSVELSLKALAINPVDPDATMNLALAYDYMGESEKAFDTYQKAIERNPDDIDMVFNLGRLYYLKEDYESAIVQFKKVLEINPDDYDAILNIGNAYLNIAETHMKKFRKMDQEGQKISRQEAMELKNKGETNYREAISYLEKAREIKPDDPNLWNNLGVAYINVGEVEKGKKAFEKAEELRNK